MLQIITIPARQDNYIWLIKKGGHAAVIDPGEAKPVLARLQALHLQLDAILLTHHHHDHIDGVVELRQAYPEVRCLGPAKLTSQFEFLEPVHDGTNLTLEELDLSLEVLHLPGHTLEHVAYYAQNALFCGDVLFAGGCGRIFDGTTEQMFHSLQRIKALPTNTHIYCAHEYTQANLAFCLKVEPENQALLKRLHAVAHARQQGLPTVPSTLSDELATNVFLRTNRDQVWHWACIHGQEEYRNEIQVFAQLRESKNNS